MARSRLWILTVCSILWITLAGLPAAAVAPGVGGEDARVRVPDFARGRAVPVTAAQDARAAAFVLEHGGEWSFEVDPRTGRAMLIQGSGIPFFPGRGNDLGPEALEGFELEDGRPTLRSVAQRVLELMQRQGDLLMPAGGTLELVPGESVVRDGGDLWSLYFRWKIGGVEVEGPRVFARINHGNITQLGAPLVGRASVNPTPVIGGDEAREILRAYAGADEALHWLGEPSLRIQLETSGDDLVQRLVWVQVYRERGAAPTWEGRVDAHTGEVVGFLDLNQYGRVRGGVFPRTVVDVETQAPMPFDSLKGESPATTDRAGSFAYGGGIIRSGLDGTFFATHCEDGCTGPSQATFETRLGAGIVDFGFGGQDGMGNGFATPAERNAFYHLNRVRLVAKQWLGITWLDSTVTVNVNIADTCNAFWNGSANFYRSGGGCNNTGEISDVVYHEWGHGLDGNTRGGDGATGEATADVVSIHLTHDARIGPYFRTDGSPVRDLDKNRTSKGLLTRSNVNSKCPGGSGPLGAEVHCEGEIYGQAAWDLAQALVAKHGHHTGWRTSERIFFVSLPDAGSYLPDQAFPVYDAYLNADDDDGNLANGTPNGDEIFDAFNLHEIAGSPVGSSPACLRPAQPTVTVTPQCDRMELTWSAVAGVDHYEVLRGEIREDAPLMELAQVAATQTAYTDTEVMPGVDYFYVVQAVAPDGCDSTVESPVAARLVPQAILSATAVTPDDTPRGNRSGFPDPGEEVDLKITLRNFGDAGAAGVAGTLTSSDPGVTVLESFDTWPDLPPDAEGTNQGVLRFTTDPNQVLCGDMVRFRLTPSEGSSCVPEDSFVDVRMGDRLAVFVDDFETDQGWTLDVAASTATTGDWTRGDPDGTTYQPEDDASEPGVQCWFTAANPSGDGGDDVDDGVTVLLSPVLDLSGLTRAVLSYSRWYANSEIGNDPEDFFQAEVSSDDGVTWVVLETLDDSVSEPAWTRREFNLEDFIPLTSKVRLRFLAQDGLNDGNIIEAAVDDVRIEEPVCDDTPACFTEPTFAGLESADPGTSCAEVNLAWQPATSNCENATITYNVYRSTDPGFVPDASTLVASDLTGTAYTDTLLEPGQSYTYVVRAFDSRSGEDSNLERRTVTAPTSPDLAPPVFDGLTGVAPGGECGETVLSWAPAQETCSGPVRYEVYRSTDPAFVPGPGNRIASTHSVGLTDAALTPGAAYTYVVRARDEAGNEDANDVRLTVSAGIKDLQLLRAEFETGTEGWAAVAPNDATTGNWEWGDPEGTEFQPEDDHTPDPGANAWITGLAAAGGGGGNDIDGGTTTLLSALYDLTGTVDPVVRYARWFTNDQGNSPGEDPLDVEVSNDDGATWTLLEQVNAGTPLAWVEVEFPLNGVITPTDQVRFRFTARDLGTGSLVEAGVDDFELADRNQGCTGCATPVSTVGTILVSRSGDDIVLDWTADPVTATRYVIYRLEGPGFGDAVRIGTTSARTFVHEGAALSLENFHYRVSAVDACGNESALE